ncbi:S24 family peptidase, partial [Candidatus Nomurabacteria bacterium]|nr:S24 family peptidase [Candidatus Nomurabacteria bacterium]
DWEELDPQFNPDYEYFGLVVRGDSMYPEYLDGDIIIVQQSECADSGKDVVAYVNGYEATLKRLYKYENGSIELRAVNPAYESKKFSIEEVKSKPVVIRGIVKELRRKK